MSIPFKFPNLTLEHEFELSDISSQNMFFFSGFDRKIRYQCFHFVDDNTPVSALRNRFNETDMAMTHSMQRGKN